MFKRSIYTVILGLACLMPSPASAQMTWSGCANPYLPGWRGVLTDGVVGSRVKLGAWLVAEDRDRAFDGRSEVDNPMQERTQIMVPLLTLDVRITDQFGVQAAASVPDVTRSALVPRPTGPVNFSENFSGLGDIAVVGWYRLLPMNQWYVVTTFGASVPTGKTETPRFKSELEDGSLVPTSRLQRGSGTLDPLVGASVTRKFTGIGTVFGSFAARLPLYENREGLRTGASSELNTGIARELLTTRISTFARLGWLRRSQDAFLGTPILVGGGHWIYLSPGIAAQVGKGINVQAEVKIPVRRSLANKQLDSRVIFQFGVSRAFWGVDAMRTLVILLSLLASGSVHSVQEDSREVVTVLAVHGMTWGACEAAVVRAAKKVQGVKDCQASVKTQTAEVRYDPAKTSPEAIATAISKATGFKASAPETKKQQMIDGP